MLDWIRRNSQGLARWLQPVVWKNWWKPPRFPWWYRPSGVPAPFSPLDYLGSPIVAHTLFGVWTFALGYGITNDPLMSYSFSVFMAIVGQFQKADALVPRGYNVQNMIYRVLITVVTIPAWWEALRRFPL